MALAGACVAASAATAQTVEFRRGMGAAELGQARVVRIAPGVRTADLAALRNDQIIQTPSGRQLQVGRLRQIQAAIAEAKAHTAQPRRGPFQILPPAQGPGRPIQPGETPAQVLARAPNDTVRLRDGRTISPAQLRAAASYLQQHGVNLSTGGRPNLAGPAIRITSVAQLRSIPRNAPDSTILETPHGVRVTVGELRNTFKARPKPGFVSTQAAR